MINIFDRKLKNIVCIVLVCLFVISAGTSLVVANGSNTFTKKKVQGVMATAVNTDVVVTWEGAAKAKGYRVYEALEDGDFQLIKDTTQKKVVLKKRTRGQRYRYYVVAYQVKKKAYTISKKSKIVNTTIPLTGKSTIKNFLQVAKSPVGSTLYVWGGGWNKADTGAGTDAKHVGLSARWRSFYQSQNSSYNYQNTRYQIRNGLDCSGYVGWCIYNVNNTKNGKKGYVYKAAEQAKRFSKKGWGKYIPKEKVKDYKAGDILSSATHVWIAVGQCDDGSVVLMHASPQGVQISGTVDKNGSEDSEAYQLAKKYMKKYYKNFYNRYGSAVKPMSYLTSYNQMRVTTTGDDMLLSDPDGYQDMNAAEVLMDLFNE